MYFSTFYRAQISIMKGIEDAYRRIGREEGRAEIIRQMHSNGINVDQICAILEILQQEIERILAKQQVPDTVGFPVRGCWNITHEQKAATTW